MSVQVSEDLAKIEELIYKGHYKQALYEVNEVIKKIEKKSRDYFLSLLLKCKILSKRSNYLDCIEIVEEALKSKTVFSDFKLKIDFLFQQATAFNQLARFDEENTVINKIEELIAKHEQSSDRIEEWSGYLHLLKGWHEINKTEFDKAESHLETSLKIFELRKDYDNLATNYVFLGSLFFRRGEFDKSLVCYQKNLELREKIGNRYEIAYAISSIGMFYTITRNTREALSYFDRCVQTVEESEDNQQIGNIYNLYGITYYYMGDLNKAFEFYEKSLFYLQQFGNKQLIAFILSNIGNVQKLRGNIDEALKAYLHCLEIFDEINSIQNIGAKMLDIGNIFLQKGDYEKSLSFLKKGLEYRRKTKSGLFIAGSLYNLIKFYCYVNNKMEANEYLKELKEINNKEENLLINHQAKIAEALILKMDNRSKSRVQAEELLTQIMNSDIIDIDSYYDAVINLCELLVTELKVTGNQEVLKELNKIIDILDKTAQEQQSFWLQAEVYWIKANLALLAWDIDGAQKLLTEAQIIAEDRGFNYLARRVSHEFDKTLDQKELWEQLRENNASVIERLEITRLDELLEKLKQQIIDISDLPAEQPVMFLIITPSGQSVYHKNFLPERISTDESLLSGFISSINVFFKEVFESTGSIERIKHHDLTILLKSVESLLFCYVFKGQSYSAIKKVDDFIFYLQVEKKEFWTDLVEQINSPKMISEKKALILEEVISKVF
ncbi:MAG: tetratricopeptide repeat protein [Candidatus Heimdallarchaeota archaeon]|nr:tetratricopeptide repeat protein [Candidatus Heimdallarchaeota archaeon]